MSANFGPLVDTRWLLDHADDQGLRLADCRSYLDGPEQGLAEYGSPLATGSE